MAMVGFDFSEFTDGPVLTSGQKIRNLMAVFFVLATDGDARDWTASEDEADMQKAIGRFEDAGLADYDRVGLEDAIRAMWIRLPKADPADPDQNAWYIMESLRLAITQDGGSVT